MRRSILIYSAFILTIVIIGYLTLQYINQHNHLDSLRSTNHKLKMKIDTLTAQLDSFHNLLIRKDSLLSQCQERSNLLLSKWDTEQLRRQGLSNPVDDLKSDLISNKEIIQEEGVLGGEMQFYSKDKIYVLNDKWVLAYYEDGHNAGSMLLAYNVGKGGTINWDVIRATSM